MEDVDKKIAHFKNLVAVAAVDGKVDDDEKEFLEEQAEDFGLDKAIVAEILKTAHELKFIVPEEEEDKEDHLADIVFLMMVDGTIDDKEYQLCLNIANRLELKKEDLDEVVALTQRLWNKS